MRISDWSSDACSSDLGTKRFITGNPLFGSLVALLQGGRPILGVIDMPILEERWVGAAGHPTTFTDRNGTRTARTRRSEEHTSELQSLMRISYAVFCLTKKTHTTTTKNVTPVTPNSSTKSTKAIYSHNLTKITQAELTTIT